MSRTARAISIAIMILALSNAFPALSSAEELSVSVDKVDSDDFPLVIAHLAIIDEKGLPVLGLAPEAVTATEDGVPIAKPTLSPLVAAQEPLAVTLVVDTSQSMAGKPLEDARNAAGSFIDELGPNDTAAIIAFAGQVLPMGDFTSDKNALKSTLATLPVGPNTALFDALIKSIELAQRAPVARRVIVVLSDGEDTSSRQPRDVALRAAASARIPIYTIGLGPNLDRRALEQIASSTGGRSLYAPSSADLQSTYRALASQLKSRYSLKFNSQVKADDNEHELVISVRRQDKKSQTTTRFKATSRAPRIAFLSPRETTLTGKMTAVEVKVESAAPVTRVDFSIDGETVSEVTREPFRFVWYRETQEPGSHVIGVTVTDAAGNRSTEEMTVSIVVPTTPEPVVAPEPLSLEAFAETPIPTHSTWMSLAPVTAAAFAIAGLVLVVSRQREARAARRRTVSRSRRWLSTPRCPVCGKRRLTPGSCRSCRDRQQRAIQERLMHFLRSDSSRQDSPS